MTNYTYNQLIELDVTCGGLTRRAAVRSRQMDRRWKKAYRNVVEQHLPPTCRIERRVMAEVGAMYDDLIDWS